MNKDEIVKKLNQDEIAKRVNGVWKAISRSSDYTDIVKDIDECEEEEMSEDTDTVKAFECDVDTETAKEFYGRVMEKFGFLFGREWFVSHIRYLSNGGIEDICFAMKDEKSKKSYSVSIDDEGHVTSNTNEANAYFTYMPMKPIFQELVKCLDKAKKMMIATSLLCHPNEILRELIDTEVK